MLTKTAPSLADAKEASLRLTSADVNEFVELAHAEGVSLSPDEARVAAMRLLLLYQHLARPTPLERQRSLQEIGNEVQ